MQTSPVLVRFDSRTAPEIVRLAKRRPSEGMLALPGTLANSSFTGKAYVTLPDSRSLYVFVPSWVGHNAHHSSDDDWVEGYLYASKPFVWRPGQDHFVDLNVPAFGEPSKARKDSRFQYIQMEVGDPIARNWYQVDSFS